jgi:ABC-2 type transport system ATP-binding protein
VSTILKVSGLSKSFGNIKAIENLSFELQKGQVLGVLGPNGSGKTTTLSIVLGVKHPNVGTFSWFDLPERILANKRIGSLIEVPYFYPYLNLERNLEIVAKVRQKGHSDIGFTLDLVGLSSRSKSAYYTLSLGMKQRLAMASALLGDPEVLVLDEPTNGLDPEGIAEVRRIIIEQSKRGKTIILASHILDEVEKVCSDVLILKNGKLLCNGPVREMLSEKAILIVNSTDNELLYNSIINQKDIEIIERKSDSILITLENNITPAQFNKWAMDQGVVISRLEEHKRTLESQFLELIKQ